MITAAIRSHIDQIMSSPGAREATAERVGKLMAAQGAAGTDADRAALVSRLEQYVRGTPDLLDMALAEASGLGIAGYLQPVVDAAAEYFLSDDDYIPDHEGLLGLLDDAYMAQSLLAGLSQLHLQMSGVPLLGASLMPANAVVRGVIGEPVASQLDAAVSAAVQQVAAQAQLDLLARQAITLDSPTGGPGAWGGSWEDEMSRIGAEAGISINW